MSYATDLADRLDGHDGALWINEAAAELRRLAAENESLVNALACIEGVALADDPRDLAGIVRLARAAIDALNKQDKQK